MRKKTKIGFIMIGIGLLIFIPIILLGFLGGLNVAQDQTTLWSIIILLIIAFMLIGIGGRMVKIRFNRWVDED